MGLFTVQEIDWSLAKYYLTGKASGTKLRRKDIIRLQSDSVSEFTQTFKVDRANKFILDLTPDEGYGLRQSFTIVDNKIYAYGNKIGRGTYSKARLCMDENNNIYAIKIQNDQKRNQVNIARANELKIERDLGILIAHAGRCDGSTKSISIVKYLGINLASYIKETKLSLEQLLDIYLQCLQEVEDLHSGKKSKSGKRYFHRDLKVNNFVIDDKGNVSLIDFGFSREMPSSGVHISIAECGTRGHRAPEIGGYLTKSLKKRSRWSTKSEIFALGVMLKELIAEFNEFGKYKNIKNLSRLMQESSFQVRPDIKWIKIALLTSFYSHKPNFLRSCLVRYNCAVTDPEQASVISACLAHANKDNGLSKTENLQAILDNKMSPQLASTLLCILAGDGYLKQLKQYLVENKLPYNSRYDGVTPLIAAIQQEQTEVVRFLLSAENPQRYLVFNSLSSQATEIYTVFDLLCANANDEIETLLVEQFSSYSLPNECHDFISVASRCGRSQLVRTLIERYPELLNYTDDCNQTPLLWAAKNSDDQLVKYLIAKKGIQLDTATNYPCSPTYHQRTPLFWALIEGHFLTASLLLAAGANPNISNGKRLSPIDYLLSEAHFDMALTLVFYGAEITKNAAEKFSFKKSHVVDVLEEGIEHLVGIDLDKTILLIRNLKKTFLSDPHTSKYEKAIQRLDNSISKLIEQRKAQQHSMEFFQPAPINRTTEQTRSIVNYGNGYSSNYS